MRLKRAALSAAPTAGAGIAKKTIGALSVPFISVEPGKFHMLKGEGTRYKASDGVFCDKWGLWLFCPDCGTTLFWMDGQGRRNTRF